MFVFHTVLLLLQAHQIAPLPTIQTGYLLSQHPHTNLHTSVILYRGAISQTKLHTSCFCLSSGTLSVHHINHAQVFPSYKMPLHNIRIMCQAACLLQNLYNSSVAVGMSSPPPRRGRHALSEVIGHRRSRLQRRW